KNRKNRLRCPVSVFPSQTDAAPKWERGAMMTNASPTQNAVSQPPAANGLAMVRLTIGAMFVWVFFENLGKGLYTPAGYTNLINYYIKASHSPAAWKAVMGFMASHAAMAAPMQAMTEISLGILLVIGLLTRPVAFVAFLFLGSLWISEWGTSWIWELLVSVLASLALAVGRAGRAWGLDALLARRWPSSPWW
ncbi:MAG TPA: DoxX family membrane protein, partial [Verrucomicrobiae bacterium]|nr:DoxX family membrane protein [Verrucomicrobiae bacterium]